MVKLVLVKILVKTKILNLKNKKRMNKLLEKKCIIFQINLFQIIFFFTLISNFISNIKNLKIYFF
jgi:hypothetical protein